MILSPAAPPATSGPAFAAGAIVRAAAGRPGGLREETRGVFAFLVAAADNAVELELQEGDAGCDGWAGDLPHVEPSRNDCTAAALTIFTSGTTGRPKPCRHVVADALSRGRPGDADARWLLAYAPFRWAGISVLLHVLRSGATLVVPESVEPVALVAAAREGDATHVSLTPSHFRRLLLSVARDDLAALPMAQITFGGEAATQPVLDEARALWPGARITHVYAASEFGDICAVSDGLAGAPCAKLERPGMELVNGELVIDGRSTGDLWERRGERYEFVGRREEVINVGGVKVSPIDVEAAALAVPGVLDARAFGTASPLLGQVVALEYCGSVEERALRRALADVLPKPAWPAALARVERIELTAAGKTARTTR